MPELLALLHGHLRIALIDSIGPFYANSARRTKLAANRVYLIAPGWSKHGVDPAGREEIVEGVLISYALGLLWLRFLTVGGESDAEFIAIVGVPVAIIIATVRVPGAVAGSSRPEVVVVVRVMLIVVAVTVTLSVVGVELAIGHGVAKLPLHLLHVFLDSLGKLTGSLASRSLSGEHSAQGTVVISLTGSGLVTHSTWGQVDQLAEIFIRIGGEERQSGEGLARAETLGNDLHLFAFSACHFSVLV